MRFEDPSSGGELGWFEVAFICTGNRARSPFAAELLRRHAGNLPVVVKSLGTLDVGPVAALPNAVRIAGGLGVDLSRHRARPLTEGALASADLVVGFEPFHVADAVVTGGAERDRTFLITELAQILVRFRMSADPTRARRPEDVVELAHEKRLEYGTVSQPVKDPVGASREDFRATFAQIRTLVTAIAEGLFGDRSSRTGL